MFHNVNDDFQQSCNRFDRILAPVPRQIFARGNAKGRLLLG